MMDKLVANIINSIMAITWEAVKAAINKDRMSHLLSNWILKGCQGKLQSLYVDIRPTWNIWAQLKLHDGVPMLGDRMIIKRKLRPCILETLESARQGTYSMMMRAKERIYWPGFTRHH